MNNKDLTIIVRSVGERTEEVCGELLKEIFPDCKIWVINEKPFTKAIKVTFELGINEAKKWTLVIDADVLVSKNGILSLINFANTQDEKVFEVQGKIIDKLFGGPRPAGNHLYRTALLKTALKYIPEPNVSLRPETYVMRSMNDVSFTWIQREEIVGLHDFEQSYFDMYRKAYTHAKKHRTSLDILLKYWIREANADGDFKAVLLGANAGLTEDKEFTIDANFFSNNLKDILKQEGLNEKEKLNSKAINSEVVENIISSFKSPKEYYELISLNEKSSNPNLINTLLNRVKSIIRK